MLHTSVLGTLSSHICFAAIAVVSSIIYTTVYTAAMESTYVRELQALGPSVSVHSEPHYILRIGLPFERDVENSLDSGLNV